MANSLILIQARENDQYSNFIGKFYHFLGNKGGNFLSQFEILPVDFVYFDPTGQGEFFGYGQVTSKPFEDNRESGYYFVEIESYKPFANAVPLEMAYRTIIESKVDINSIQQNIVSKIPRELLDQICLDGGFVMNFEADSHLIKVLGEQLIASERVGILELIKNAYDANARECTVTIEKLVSLPSVSNSLYRFNSYESPVIVIEDDGIGMNRETIEKGWLRPASTLKTNIKDRLKREREKAELKGTLENYERLIKQLKKEHRGRIPLGEKGVGRFATHRLGRYLTIKTKTSDIDYELILDIDWNEFDLISDTPVNLNSIGVKLKKQEISRDYGPTNSGTQIIIYGGREGFNLDENEIKEINESINRLNSPFPNPKADKSTFDVKFICPQYDVLKPNAIENSFDPVFTIDGIVDEWGNFDYEYKFIPPNTVTLPLASEQFNEVIDLKSKYENKKYWQNPDNPKQYRRPWCGSFYVHLDIWFRSSPWIVGPDAKAFKTYLEDYGGISVYRDGINIFPAEWGAEVDWLKLSKRHIKQGFRISYYNFVGNIELEQGNNVNLIDKTNREGLIKNRAANDLTELTRSIIFHFENYFRAKRDEHTILSDKNRRTPQSLMVDVKKSASIIENISKSSYNFESDPFEFFKEIDDFTIDQRKLKLIDLSGSLKNLQGSLNAIQNVQDTLTENAGFGISIAVAVHELNKLTAQFYYGITEMLEKGNTSEHQLRALQESSQSLNSELRRLSPLRAIRNKERVKFGIQESIKYSQSIYRRRFKKLDISFNSNDENFELFSRYEAINQVITNLLDNSCFWLDSEKFKERRIEVKINKANRTVIIADNGPNIHTSIFQYLFEPGYSLKVPPSGLGLYICKYYMKSEKGDIYLTPKNNRIPDMPGAQLTLDFSHTPEN